MRYQQSLEWVAETAGSLIDDAAAPTDVELLAACCVSLAAALQRLAAVDVCNGGEESHAHHQMVCARLTDLQDALRSKGEQSWTEPPYEDPELVPGMVVAAADDLTCQWFVAVARTGTTTFLLSGETDIWAYRNFLPDRLRVVYDPRTAVDPAGGAS